MRKKHIFVEKPSLNLSSASFVYALSLGLLSPRAGKCHRELAQRESYLFLNHNELALMNERMSAFSSRGEVVG